ncbi:MULTISPECIES: enoyl-CoA hydratase/isomerase family protein [unclassified Carboxydocella]|uniref:enoyl-CoA hydratase/isomerase family protein n=1 Tax=unclassified Carboxydocella TaxID=2685367 RepID=UPI0009AC5950|nr:MULTISPECIES: enoyl-CoA hydratase/isomerase family protein [unclassified Carboxydocella]GAW28120.1 enoyl-CoA hydratase [Carboxydocella sp. ULO1]GAW30982.1 enoyl-CoA hydratase [Carboxydocella sp. JDF658]
MAEKTLILEYLDNLALITLNRPAALNTINLDLLQEMEEIQQKLAQDPNLRAVMVQAAGPHFSAGIDLSLLAQVDASFVLQQVQRLQQIFQRWQQLTVPVIAAIQGVCFGSGLELVLACDLRIAAANARFALPEVRFGLAPDLGGTSRLTKLVGAGQAKRLLLTCEEIDAQEAKTIGLVEKVVPEAELEKAALGWAQAIASFPPAGLRFAKQGVQVAQEASLAAALLFEQAQSVYCCGTQEQKEAIAAFFRKQK